MNIIIVDHASPNGRYPITAFNARVQVDGKPLAVNYFHSTEQARAWCEMNGHEIVEGTINEENRQ